MATMKFTVPASSQAFFRGSMDAVRASRHPMLRTIGNRRRDKIAAIVMAEWEILQPRYEGTHKTKEDFHEELRRVVLMRVRQQEVGFVWWLPLVLWAAELIIKIIIERWWPK